MSNVQDVVLWAMGLGDNCPSLATIQMALSGGAKYAKNGDSPYPGVMFVDVDKGLVHIDALDVKAPGQTFCAYPAINSLDPKGEGTATVEYNSAFAAGSDRGNGMWFRVMPMVRQDSEARPFIPNVQANWVPNAWSVGNEFADWPSVVDHLLNHWQMSHN